MSENNYDSLFTTSEIGFLRSMDALCHDKEGRIVLLGLSFEETCEYLIGYRKNMTSPDSNNAAKNFLALSRKHEVARSAALASMRIPPIG